MSDSKAMTVRLAADQAEALETVASVDEIPVVEVIRTAVAEYIRSRTQDAAFQRKLREKIKRTQAMLREE